jgi:hypothetical protein
VSNYPQPLCNQAIAQIVNDNIHVAQKQAGAKSLLIRGVLERFPGSPLVPVNDDELLFKVSLEIVGEVHCGHPGSAVNKEQYGLFLVYTPDKKILGVPVDI